MIRHSATRRAALVAASVACLWSGLAEAQQSWPDLSAAPPVQGGGDKDAAVIVGIGDYFVVPDVTGAADNARNWYAHLVRGLGVAPARATLLRNNEGTREKILARFEAAAKSVEPGGTLWFVFIGHGAPGPKGQRGALVGADAQAEADSLYARSIFQDEILAIAATGKQARTIVVLDACFSGLTGQGTPIVDGLQPLIPVKANTKTAKGLTVFTAGGAEQFAGPLPGADRPAFSYLLLGALRGWADADSDKAVTAQEAVDYTRQALATLLRDRTQTPTLLTADAGATLSAPALEKGPDLAAAAMAPTPKVSAPSAGPGKLRLEAKDGGTYTMQIITADGDVIPCPEDIERKTPCTLDNVPPGRATIQIGGDAKHTKEINIGRESIVMNVDGAEQWYGWAAVACIGGFFVAGGVGGALLGSDDKTNAAIGTGLFLGGSTVFSTASLVFAVLWLLEKDTVGVDRYDIKASDAGDLDLRIGLAGDGLGLGLEVAW